MKYTFDEFKKELETAAKNNTLLTPKHDPNNLGTTYTSFRTVLSHDLVKENNLTNFIESGNYTVNEYENKKLQVSPLYFEITPKSNSCFSIPGSGVTSNSIFASTVADRIIAVSGQTQGWHLMAEDSSIIQRKISIGDLDFKGSLI